MKRIILLALVFLNVGVIPALAAEFTIVDKVATSTSEQIDLSIPEAAEVGHHILTVQVSDNVGIITSRDIVFCKSTLGEIRWDDICPDVTEMVDPNSLAGITDPNKLPLYDPASDAKNVAKLMVGTFTVLGAVATGSSSSSSNSSSSGEIESIEDGELRHIRRKQGRGDRSSTWRWPLTALFDREFNLLARDISRYSPLLGRVIADGNYFRAMFGSLTVLLYPFAVYLGLCALHVTTWQSLPAVPTLMILGMGIGLLDSFAGFTTAYVFLMGVMVAGHFASRHQIIGTIGTIIIWFAPTLVASNFRPLRREVVDRDTLWERISDYALSMLLSGWVVQKMVNALPGLTGHQLSFSGHANQLAVIAGGLVGLRFALEDVGTYFYPERSEALQPKLKEPVSTQPLTAIFFKTFFFGFIAELFVGNSIYFWLGVLVFLGTQLLEHFEEELPNREWIKRILPAGAVKTLLMIYVGGVLSSILQSKIPNAHSFLRESFFLLALPGLALKYASVSAEPREPKWHKTPRGRWIYRIGGALVYLVLFLYIKGVDVVTPVQHFLHL